MDLGHGSPSIGYTAFAKTVRYYLQPVDVARFFVSRSSGLPEG